MTDPEHPFITAQHADNIVDAANKLGATIRRDAEARAKHHTEIVALLTAQRAALDRIADNTANLPALMAVLMTKQANGSVAHTDDTEGEST